jgi:predicted NodU family carbamoyl transferase
MANISFHGSHNGAIVIEQNKEILCVIEIERFLNYKNVGIAQYKTPRYIMIVVEEILKWVEKEYGIKEFDNCYFIPAADDSGIPLGCAWFGYQQISEITETAFLSPYIGKTYSPSEINKALQIAQKTIPGIAPGVAPG